MDNNPVITPKPVSQWEKEKIIFNFRELVQRQNFIIRFISPVLSSGGSYEVQHSFSTFGVAINDFFKEDIQNSRTKNMQYGANSLGIRFLSTR